MEEINMRQKFSPLKDELQGKNDPFVNDWPTTVSLFDY